MLISLLLASQHATVVAFNPFTAPACQFLGLKFTHTHTHTHTHTPANSQISFHMLNTKTDFKRRLEDFIFLAFIDQFLINITAVKGLNITVTKINSASYSFISFFSNAFQRMKM